MAQDRDFADRHIERCVDEWPGLDLEVEAATVRISMLARHIDQTLAETLRDFSLSEGEYRVLVKLKTQAPPYRLTPTQLQKMLLVSSGAMTNRLDGLEEEGLITRTPDPKDRRGVIIELTDVGEKRVLEAVAIQAKKEKQILAGLSDKDMRSLNDALRKAVFAVGEPLMESYTRES